MLCSMRPVSRNLLKWKGNASTLTLVSPLLSLIGLLLFGFYFYLFLLERKQKVIKSIVPPIAQSTSLHPRRIKGKRKSKNKKHEKR